MGCCSSKRAVGVAERGDGSEKKHNSLTAPDNTTGTHSTERTSCFDPHDSVPEAAPIPATAPPHTATVARASLSPPPQTPKTTSSSSPSPLSAKETTALASTHDDLEETPQDVDVDARSQHSVGISARATTPSSSGSAYHESEGTAVSAVVTQTSHEEALSSEESSRTASSASETVVESTTTSERDDARRQSSPHLRESHSGDPAQTHSQSVGSEQSALGSRAFSSTTESADLPLENVNRSQDGALLAPEPQRRLRTLQAPETLLSSSPSSPLSSLVEPVSQRHVPHAVPFRRHLMAPSQQFGSANNDDGIPVSSHEGGGQVSYSSAASTGGSAAAPRRAPSALPQFVDTPARDVSSDAGGGVTSSDAVLRGYSHQGDTTAGIGADVDAVSESISSEDDSNQSASVVSSITPSSTPAVARVEPLAPVSSRGPRHTFLAESFRMRQPKSQTTYLQEMWYVQHSAMNEA